MWHSHGQTHPMESVVCKGNKSRDCIQNPVFVQMPVSILQQFVQQPTGHSIGVVPSDSSSQSALILSRMLIPLAPLKSHTSDGSDPLSPVPSNVIFFSLVKSPSSVGRVPTKPEFLLRRMKPRVVSLPMLVLIVPENWA